MAYSVYTLNNRINFLQSEINNLLPSVGTLQEVIDNSDVLNGSAPSANQIIQFDGTDVIWANPTTISPSLQDVINQSDLLAGVAPTTTQVIQYNGTDVIWNNVAVPVLNEVLTAGNNANGLDIINLNDLGVTTINGSAYPPPVDTLQAVLTAGNNSDVSVVLKDDLITPTSTNTLTDSSMTFSVPASTTTTSYSGGGLSVSTGDINTVGSAGANITASANNQTAFSLTNSQATAPPFFSPPQGVATILTTPSSSSLQLSYAGQFTVGKSVTVDLDKVQHQADGNLNYIVQSNGNLDLNAGDATFGFKKVRINTNGTNPNQLTLEKQEVRITDTGDPTGDSRCQLNSNQVFVAGKNPLAIQATMSTSGFSIGDANLSQSTSYQTNRTTTNKNYTIQNTGAVGNSNLTLSTPNGNVLMTSQNFNVASGSVGINSPTANLSITPSSILYTNPTVPTAPLFISSQNDLTILSDNVDLSNTTMKLINASPSGVSTPQFIVENTNATAGTTIGVPTIQTLKSGRNVVVGDMIGSITNWAKNYLGVLKEWFRMETVITNSSAGGGDDASLDIYTLVNGVLSLVWRFNGADNENNSFRPIDMNGQDVKTSSGNLAISTLSSSGAGTITISPKAGTFVNIPSAVDSSNDYIRINPQVSPNAQQVLMTANNGAGFANSINLLNGQFNPFLELKADFGGAINKSVSLNVNGNGSTPNSISSYDGQTNLPFQIVSTGITNGSIEFVPQSATGDLIFTGANIQTATAGGNSGQHLRIKLNGTYYKIKLEDD